MLPGFVRSCTSETKGKRFEPLMSPVMWTYAHTFNLIDTAHVERVLLLRTQSTYRSTIYHQTRQRMVIQVE